MAPRSPTDRTPRRSRRELRELDRATTFVCGAAARAGLIRLSGDAKVDWTYLDRFVESASGRAPDALTAADWLLIGVGLGACVHAGVAS